MASVATPAPAPRVGGIADRVVVVTGGSSGIGRATCIELARSGARVAVVGRSPARLEETLADMSAGAPGAPPAIAVPTDVSSEAEVDRMLRQTEEGLGRVWALVACAAVAKASERGLPTNFWDLDVADWDNVLATNLRGIFLSDRAVLRHMLPAGEGRIINVASSPGAIHGEPYAAAYCASKFAVAGLSEALAAEVEPDGIHVQALFPDLVATPMIENSTLTARLGPALPVERVARHIVSLLSLPDDLILPTAHGLGYPVLRHLPEKVAHWRR